LALSSLALLPAVQPLQLGLNALYLPLFGLDLVEQAQRHLSRTVDGSLFL
jgi:hypothetical protein